MKISKRAFIVKFSGGVFLTFGLSIFAVKYCCYNYPVKSKKMIINLFDSDYLKLINDSKKVIIIKKLIEFDLVPNSETVLNKTDYKHKIFNKEFKLPFGISCNYDLTSEVLFIIFIYFYLLLTLLS